MLPRIRFRNPKSKSGKIEVLRPTGHARFRILHPDYSIRYEETSYRPNLIVNEGLDHIMLNGLSGSFIGLVTTTDTFAATDTMASHAGWTEFTSYSETLLQAYTVAVTATAGTVNNAGNLATFSFNASDTVGGFFLKSTNTKNTGTGTLISGRTLVANQAVLNGEFGDVDYEFVGS